MISAQFVMAVAGGLVSIILTLFGVIWYQHNQRIKRLEDELAAMEAKLEGKFTRTTERLFKKLDEIRDMFLLSQTENAKNFLTKTDCDRCQEKQI